MRKSLHTSGGFAAVELALTLVIIGIAGGVGFWVATQHKPTTPQAAVVPASTTKVSTAKTGTTAGIDQLTAGDASAENAIDKKYQSTEQSDTTSADTAAKNVGGAYDESSL